MAATGEIDPAKTPKIGDIILPSDGAAAIGLEPAAAERSCERSRLTA